MEGHLEYNIILTDVFVFQNADLLKHKIQQRPDRQALVQQHILEGKLRNYNALGINVSNCELVYVIRSHFSGSVYHSHPHLIKPSLKKPYSLDFSLCFAG